MLAPVENSEIVRRSNVQALGPVYEAWARGDWRRRPDVYALEMEWGWSEEFPEFSGVFSDADVISRRLRAWLAPWEDWRCAAEEFITAGEFVVVLTRYTGRGKESGVAVDSRGAHVWTMRAGEAVRLEVFSSRTKALAAAGLPEMTPGAEADDQARGGR